MKASEQPDFQAFFELLNQIDPSACDYDVQPPAPDVLIQLPNSTIGIEHTRLYREDPDVPSGRQLRPQELIHQELAERARVIFHQFSDRNLHLNVVFSEPFNYSRGDVQEIAATLAQSVLMTFLLPVFPDSSRETIRVHSWQARRLGLPFPNGVQWYAFMDVGKPEYELWGPAYGYAVPDLLIHDVESRIREKEKRTDGYRLHCTKLWLLLVTESGMPSSHLQISDTLKQHVFSTSFDRIFLLSIFRRSLIELRTTSPIGSDI